MYSKYLLILSNIICFVETVRKIGHRLCPQLMGISLNRAKMMHPLGAGDGFTFFKSGFQVHLQTNVPYLFF